MENKRKLLFLALFLILSIITSYYRFIPFFEYRKQVLRETAQEQIFTNSINEIENSIKVKYPNAPVLQRQVMAKQMFSKLLSKNQVLVHNQVKQNYKSLLKKSSSYANNYLIAA